MGKLKNIVEQVHADVAGCSANVVKEIEANVQAIFKLLFVSKAKFWLLFYVVSWYKL